MKPDELEELQAAIKRLHGCGSRHARSVEVSEVVQGKPVWEGVVEAFDLIGHGKAAKAYVWKHEGADNTRVVAILALPPVKTARDAVRAFIAEAK